MAKKEVIYNGDGKAQATAARTISIIVFTVLMACLLSFPTTLFVICGSSAFLFIGMALGYGLLFFWFFLVYIISFISIIGFVIPENYKFWPGTFIRDIIGGSINRVKLQEFDRVAILSASWTVFVILLLCFIGSIVALRLNKAAKKRSCEFNLVPAKKFSVNAFIFSFFGLIFIVGCLVLLTA